MKGHMERVTIIQADFTETLRQVADMGGADLILTSPPYPGVARTYGQSADAAVWTLADYQRLGDAVKLALKPGGHCLMVLDAPVREWRKGYGTERGFLPWQVMLDWGERVGLRVPDRLAYGRTGGAGEYLGRFRNDWEPLLWFQCPGAGGYFDKWAIARRVDPYKRQRASAWKPDSTQRVRAMSGKASDEGWAHRGTLWNFGHVGHGHDDGESTMHSARYFTGFAEDAVRCFCPSDGLVVDPFSGSGTTAAAALIHGRRFFGGDLLARPSDGKPWAEIGAERARRALIRSRLQAALDEER